MELALGQGFQNVRSMKWQVTADPPRRLFRARGQPRAPSGKGLTLTSRERAPCPPPPAAPRQPPPVLGFSQTGGSGYRPWGQRQGGAPLRRAHARASARGWSKQTLLKGHFFRLRLRRPEEAAIIFQGCKCQKKNSPSPSFPPCPSSAQRLLTRHFLAK